MIPPSTPRTARARLSFAVLLLVACNSAPSASEQAQPSDQTEAAPSGENSESSQAAPVIASDEATFDFGTVSPTGSVTHVFKLVNRGNADLKIERVERT